MKMVTDTCEVLKDCMWFGHCVDTFLGLFLFFLFAEVNLEIHFLVSDLGLQTYSLIKRLWGSLYLHRISFMYWYTAVLTYKGTVCDRNHIVCSENFCKTDSWGLIRDVYVCINVCVFVKGWGLLMLSVFARLVSALWVRDVYKWQVWLWEPHCELFNSPSLSLIRLTEYALKWKKWENNRFNVKPVSTDPKQTWNLC